jgi:glycosyltransferase involved in cell wall biosynthesis
MAIALSIVVPFHNEEKNIKLVLEEYRKLSKKADFQLVCVNDGSQDGSSAVFSKLLASGKYPFVTFVDISQKNHVGYGHAIMTGLRQATGEVLGWTHSDLQTDPADTLKAHQKFLEHQDHKIIFKGKRIKRTFGQTAFSYGMAAIASTILGTWLYEINAQPKIFHRSLLKKMKNPPTDFSLDLYLLHLAKKEGYIIKNIDVLFKKRQFGESKWAFSFRSKIKTIRRTIAYIFALQKRRS